jgi:hypothetical protein
MKRIRRRRKHGSKAKAALGVAWYSKEEWDRLREVAEDPDLLEENYEEWVEVFEGSLRQLSKAGILPDRIEVRVDELVEWCHRKSLPIDAKARSQFVAEALHERHRQGS